MTGALPVDIFYSTLEHMDNDKPGLATLCLVNRAFREATESVLYRRIVMPLPAVSRVCISLASERLAAHVRHFETSKKPGWKPRDARELLHMRTALRKMTGLRTLRIHFGGPMAWILDGCKFAELQSMLCNLSCDYHLAHFFKRQAQLTDVTLTTVHTRHFPCLIDQSCLPNLKQISADPAWLGMLVPYRPITRVDVWDFIETGALEVGWLLQSSTMVTILSVSETFLSSRGVARVAQLVPQLRQLTIKCCTPDLLLDEQETEKKEEFVDLVTRTLNLFESLTGLEVHFRGLSPDEDSLLRQFVVKASESALNLQTFIMAFVLPSGEQHTKIAWRRWEEDWRRES